MGKSLLFALLLACAAASATAKFCSAPDMTCLTSGTLCAGNTVYKCAAGMACLDDEGCKPVKDEGYQCMMGRFKCIDNKHFCNGNIAQRCAPGTWCKDGNDALTPCRAHRPNGSCVGGPWACQDRKTYCLGGKTFTCPAGWVCVGYGPCVKRA